MANRDTGAETLAALFREQRRRIGAARRREEAPASTTSADESIAAGDASPGFTTDASGSWTRWADWGNGDDPPPAA